MSTRSNRRRTWRVLDYGCVPVDALTVPFEAECGHEAELPVVGRVMAMTSGGAIIFDVGDRAIPNKIKCRRCGRVYGSDIYLKSLDIDTPDVVTTPVLKFPAERFTEDK